MARTYNSGHRDWFNTKSANINDNFVVEGLAEQMKQLDSLLSTNPEMEKRMQKVIRTVLARARREMQKDFKSEMPNDPRQAYKAVKMSVYRRILGGNINILNKKRATRGASPYRPTRTLKSGQRGGNRQSRSDRTMRMDSYQAEDRGFILRFLNSGTDSRQIKGFRTDEHRGKVKRGSQGGNLSKYGNLANVNTGNRGKIGAKNIFGSHMIELGEYIDKELTKAFGDLLKGAGNG